MTADSDGSSLEVQILIIVLTALNAFLPQRRLRCVYQPRGKWHKERKKEIKSNQGNALVRRIPDEFLATIQVATFCRILLECVCRNKFLFTNSTIIRETFLELETLALIIVTVVLSYLTLVFGELYPKQVALQVAEPIALNTAGIILFVKRSQNHSYGFDVLNRVIKTNYTD